MLRALVVCLLSAPGWAQAFERVERSEWEGRVSAESVTVPTGCTLPGGPGDILATSTRGDGTIFVAAERGWFIGAPGFDALDPLDLRSGTPRGRPIGLVAEADRLWLATDQELACVDPLTFTGRVWSRPVVPEPPYSAFGVAGDGRLLLVSADGVFAYRTGQLPRPVISARMRDDLYQLEVQTGPGIDAIYRRLDHHRWLPLDSDAPRLPAMAPGRRAVEIVGIDRELQRSEPVRLDFEVPYPFYYGKAFLLSVVGFATLLVFAWFGLRSRKRGRDVWLRNTASAVLVVVFGLQILAAVLRHGRSWPFVGFSMYTETYEERALLYKLVLVARRGSGWFEIPYHWGGTYASDGIQGYIPLIFGGEPAMREFFERGNQRHPDDPVDGIRVQWVRHRLTEIGPVPVAPLVLADYEVGG